MSKKRQQRVKEISEQLASSYHDATEKEVLGSKGDAELFVVDTVGSKTARKRIAKEIVAVTTRPDDSKLIKKFEERREKRQRTETAPVVSTYDIWDSEPVTKTPSTGPKRGVRPGAGKQRVIAVPGQSYNPSHKDHQDVIAEATAIEIRKREDESSNAPVSQAVAVAAVEQEQTPEGDGESSDEEESEAEDENNRSTGRIFTMPKPKTRAQRNKQKAKNADKQVKRQMKHEKKLLSSIDKIDRITETVVEEAEYRQHLAELRKQQKEKVTQGLHNIAGISFVQASLIPLSDELSGSLRTVVPKGNRLKDELLSMVVAGDANLKGRRRRKATEKPHAAKNIKWFPKYKAL